MTKRNFAAMTFAFLMFSLIGVSPAQAEPQLICDETGCTATFLYTGQPEIWNLPVGVKEVTFELHGAQGGKSGGLGGFITGRIPNPPASLVVVVGGVGLSGSGIEGGFNGGGKAGVGEYPVGSGGGATDLRLNAEISSRIAVAGGGGGKGAGLGGNGGLGGGLNGGNGKTGQGYGGGGGTQTSGGYGGTRYGTGTSGTVGQLALGGIGGSSTMFSGGGGGGGYFGGGGGGSDTDSCCYDGGGGGGGSSFSDPTLVTDVSHSQGVRPGSGMAILRYKVSPVALGISNQLEITNLNQIIFEIEFNQPVSDLTPEDIEIIGPVGCRVAEITSLDSRYQILVSDCEDGEVGIRLRENSVNIAGQLGPDQAIESGQTLLDSTAPEVLQLEVVEDFVTLEFSEAVIAIEPNLLRLETENENCSLTFEQVEYSNIFQANLISCQEANYTLSVPIDSFQDVAGNLGPKSLAQIIFELPIQIPSQPTEDPQEAPQESPQEIVPVETEEGPEPKAPLEKPTTLDSASEIIETSDQPMTDGEILEIQPLGPPQELKQAAQTLITESQDQADNSAGVVIWLAIAGALAIAGGLLLARKTLPFGLTS
ncbi:MAG: glycine-rich protein [Actinomycetota bacterium]